MPGAIRKQILWFSPTERATVSPQNFHISRRLQRLLNQKQFHCTFDCAFDDVVDGCANRESSWIDSQVRKCYGELHRIGFAHSVETWHGGELVGGSYGVAFGRLFAAESMFYKEPNASKVALVHLANRLASWEFELIDAQWLTPHLETLGFHTMSRTEYMGYVRENLRNSSSIAGSWQYRKDPPWRSSTSEG